MQHETAMDYGEFADLCTEFWHSTKDWYDQRTTDNWLVDVIQHGRESKILSELGAAFAYAAYKAGSVMPAVLGGSYFERKRADLVCSWADEHADVLSGLGRRSIEFVARELPDGLRTTAALEVAGSHGYEHMAAVIEAGMK